MVVGETIPGLSMYLSELTGSWCFHSENHNVKKFYVVSFSLVQNLKKEILQSFFFSIEVSLKIV